jgi:hypothetical protein
MSEPRVVCHFSCGAASAVATKLAIADYGHERVVILNAFIVEEHPDNRRFALDCEKWFQHPVTVLRDQKYGASAREVWRRKGFIKNGAFGAACSGHLKREVIEAACLDTDLHVLGFTVEEADRAARFKPPAGIAPAHLFPLIDRNLSKPDCLAIIERAGIELPMLYRMGYSNANCIGCCKGGRGYFNKIRRDFPEDFNEIVQIEKQIGPTSYIFWHRDTLVRFPLDELRPDEGKHDEVVPDCSFFCAMAEEELQ